ncbi:MAG: GntR family transcriptional regulator [Clostridia bacterium]|nr:GntR family transcriptional regulator [Clostridia bacterium]
MISFENFSPQEGIPIYLQIIRYFKRNIVAGVITDGDEVPSRRVLSALLGVNPNTIQKAYRILEEEQLMENRAGAKSCMLITKEQVERIRREILESDAVSVIQSFKEMGLDKNEAIRLIENLWN